MDIKIECIEIKSRRAHTAELMSIWESAIRATHAFLSEKQIKDISEYVPHALESVPLLAVARQGGKAVGFAGADGDKLEMLFVAAESIGRGIGKLLLEYVTENYGVTMLTVNEQNPQAIGFYEHMGFKVYKRSDTDEQGGAYPILYMRR